MNTNTSSVLKIEVVLPRQACLAEKSKAVERYANYGVWCALVLNAEAGFQKFRHAYGPFMANSDGEVFLIARVDEINPQPLSHTAYLRRHFGFYGNPCDGLKVTLSKRQLSDFTELQKEHLFPKP